MTRSNFTQCVGQLIHQASLFGFDVILDWVKRDRETQKRMFDQGLSKADGTNKISAHQIGKAVDLYIIEGGKISEDKHKYQMLHDYWMILGGKPMINWDLAHFEV